MSPSKTTPAPNSTSSVQGNVDNADLKSAIDLATAPGWRPEPGAILKGRIVKISVGESEFSGVQRKHPIVTVETADGYVNVHAFHQTLRESMVERGIRPGDDITVAYVGARPKKDTDPQSADPRDKYHLYVLNPSTDAGESVDIGSFSE